MDLGSRLDSGHGCERCDIASDDVVWPMVLKKSAVEGSGRWFRGPASRCRGSGRHRLDRRGDELSELAEVLGCGGEVELVSGAVRAP